MNVAKRSFVGGEIAPALWARSDYSKYAAGLRTLRNMTILPSGGVQNRAGTQYLFVAQAVSKLVKFVPSSAESYVLEFHDRAVRIYRNGGSLDYSGAPTWETGHAYRVGDVVFWYNSPISLGYAYAIANHTSAAATFPITGADYATVWYVLPTSVLTSGNFEIPSPYAAADVAEIRVAQTGDTMTIVHPDYPVHELQYSPNRWALSPVVFAPAMLSPGNLALAGGTAATVYYAVTAVSNETAEESLPTIVTAANRLPTAVAPTTVTWNPVVGARMYRVYRSTDGQTYGYIGVGGGTPVDMTDLTWSDTNEVATTTSTNVWVPAAGQLRNPLTLGAVTDKAFDGIYKVRGHLTLSAAGGTPSYVEGRVRAYYSRDGETRVDSGITYSLRIYGVATVGPIPFELVVAVPDNGYAALTIDVVPEVYGVASAGTPTFTATADASTAADLVAWQRNGTGFVDPAIAPDFTAKPPVARNPFAAPGQYPATASYYQQRRLLARSDDLPQTVWASKTGLPGNFTASTPLQSDDAVTFTIQGRTVTEVKHLVDLERLVILTAGGEYVADGGDGGTITPTTINLRRVSGNGSADIPPIVVNDTLLYVQRMGGAVRDFLPDAALAIDGYRGSDISIFASHLFRGYSVVDWDYQQTPDSTVWVVRSDGALLGLTYLREHSIWGWHRHDTDGTVENVVVVPEGDEDRVYLIVRRTINSVSVRYIERMASRRIATEPTSAALDALCFMDCSTVSDAWTTTGTLTLSGATWTGGASLTLTATAATPFSIGMIGETWFLEDADGARLRLEITGYTSNTVVTVEPETTVPATLRTLPSARYARGQTTVSGLSHLNGKAVSVLADGYVVASPNNPDYTAITVTAGSITLPEPYAYVRVGLPYLSDIQSLDLDTPSGPSVKGEKKLNVREVGLMVHQSRGIWAGRLPPEEHPQTDGTATFELQEYPAHTDEGVGGDPFDVAPGLFTNDLTIPIPGDWNSHGRVFVRQVDALPMSVLAIMPRGSL